MIGGQCCGAEPICGALEQGGKGGKGKGGKGANAAGQAEERDVQLYSHSGSAVAPGCARIQVRTRAPNPESETLDPRPEILDWALSPGP